VAGILGAEGNNGLGVVGVNWDVSVITSKFIGGGIGTLEDALDAIDYMTFLKTRGTHAANLVAVNASWGGGGYSQAMHDALIRLANAGILFVAAAGNGGPDQVADDNDRMPFYPANYDTSQGTSTQPAASFNAVIAVAAIGSDGQLPPWSNYGLNTVHLAAPGVGILSTVPTDLYSSGYEYFSGTSMATPHVTGAAALFLSANPGATAPQVREAILASVAPTLSLEGKTATGGRLDLGALLEFGSVPPPPPPTATTLHVGSITVTTLNMGRGQKKGRAEVFIVDETGNPVANALVSGSFTGSLNESASKTTSSAGLAVLETTGTAKGGVIFTFCVESVAHPDLQYDPGSNSETCD
jgi:subtilisin family serine protease